MSQNIKSLKNDGRDLTQLAGESDIQKPSHRGALINQILQNAATLEKNREPASLCALSSQQRDKDIDEHARGSDNNPHPIKDLPTQQTFNRGYCLKPSEFHKLLCQRVDVSAG